VSVDTSTVSYDHDGRICISGWTLDKPSRDCSPYVSDIASIVHKTEVGIYGLALSNASWTVVTGATWPNEDGEFEVTEPNGGIILTLPNNYVDRLSTHVPQQTAPEPVPQAYMTRQHDYYYNAPSNPERHHEPVYSWLGWGYLYIPLFADYKEVDVTVTISYYGSDWHSDNHFTDSTRQTEYKYTLGELTTIERKIRTTDFLQELCVDLAATVPLRIVHSIRLLFSKAGHYRIWEPRLRLDSGSDQEDREPGHPHVYLKEFEHWEYKRGGISACVDGQYLEGIAWPDSSHKNTFEPTGGHFDYRVGAKSGIDFTTAWSLAGYLSFIERCCDAWEATYNTSAVECFDLRPVNRWTSDNMDVAVRVGQWTTAPGLHYDFTAEKIVGGQVHGWSGENGSRVRNSTCVSRLYRRATLKPDWEFVEDLSSDVHGHFHSSSKMIFRSYLFDRAFYWDYGVGWSVNDVNDVGHFATREYVVGYTYGAVHQTIWFGSFGLLHQLYLDDDDILLRWLPWPRLSWSDPVRICAASGADDLFLGGRHGTPRLYMSWRCGDVVHFAWTEDLGVTIGAHYTADMKWSTVRHVVASRFWFTLGYYDDAWRLKVRLADDKTFNWLQFPSMKGEDDPTEVVIEDLGQSNDAVFLSDRYHRLIIIGDDSVYISYDWGSSWEYAGHCDEQGWSNIRGRTKGDRFGLVGLNDNVWQFVHGYRSSEGDITWLIGPTDVGSKFNGDIGFDIDGREVQVVTIPHNGDFAVRYSDNLGVTWRDLT